MESHHAPARIAAQLCKEMGWHDLVNTKITVHEGSVEVLSGPDGRIVIRFGGPPSLEYEIDEKSLAQRLEDSDPAVLRETAERLRAELLSKS